MGWDNTIAQDLNEHSLDALRDLIDHERHFPHYERCRYVLAEITWRDVAYPRYRWEHLFSFCEDSKQFDVWVTLGRSGAD